MSKEAQSGQSFDPWSQGNDLIQLIRETISTNSLDCRTGINDNQQNFISTFLHDIKAVLQFGYTDNSQPLTDILITATSLYVYSLQNDVTPLFNELVTIFDENNSFYINNANYQTPSIKWAQVVDSFLQTDSIEKISDRLSRNDKYLTEGHFLSSGKVLDILKNYLTKTEGGVERLRNAISIIIRGFSAFVTSRNFEESFLTVYSLYLKIVQSCPVLYASSNKSDQSKSSSDLLEGFVEVISSLIIIGSNSNKSYLLDFCFNQILELLPIDLVHPLLTTENFSGTLLGSLDTYQDSQIERLLPLFKLYAQSGLFTDSNILNFLYSRGFVSIITDCLQYIQFSVIAQFTQHLDLNQNNVNLLLKVASSITETNTSGASPDEVSHFVTSIITSIILYGLEDDNKHDFVFNAILAILSSSSINNYFIKSLFSESLRLIVEDKNIQHRSALPVEILTQLFSDASIPDDSIDFDFVVQQLFRPGDARQRESWLKLVDMILSSTNLYITDNSFSSNNVHLSLNDENDVWSIIGHLIEIHGLEAFDKSGLGFITGYLEDLQNGTQSNQPINPNFVRFATNFILCQNVQTKKIEMQTMSDKRIKTKTLQKFINSQYVVKMVPLDYDYLLFNIIVSEPSQNHLEAIEAAQKAIVSIYEKVDTTRVSDVIDMFQKKLQNTSFGSTPQQCDYSFAAILRALLDFSMKIEKESDIIPGILGFSRHSQQGVEKDYPLQLRIYNTKEYQTFTVDCSLDMKIFELKAIIAAKLNVRAEPLFLYHDNQWLQDDFLVSDYHIANNTCLDLGGKLQPMSQSNYPTILLHERNFASYLLNSINSDSTIEKRIAVMNFLDYLPTEEKIGNIVNDGYYFVAMVRNAETIEHLRYIIDTACSSCNNEEVIENFSQCNVLTSLYSDLHRNKFGSKGVETLLHFFLMFNHSLSHPVVLNEFIPSLLNVYSIEDGNDELYQSTTALLRNFLRNYPQETTEISLSNTNLLAEAIRRVPPSCFNDLKSFICNLEDQFSVKLFALAYGTEPRFEEISQELFNVNVNANIDDSDFVEKNLYILEQLDEAPFKELFSKFTSRLNRDSIDRNRNITESLLKIAQRTKSDKIREEIFRQVADFSLQSQTAKQSISEFSKEISNVSVYSNIFNVSQLDFQQSDINSKILISDRDDIASIIQILFHTFPFNYYILTSNSFDNEAMWKLQYIFKQMILLYKQSIDATEVTNQFINLFSSNFESNAQHDPVEFFQKLSNLLPDHIRNVFEGTLHITIEGDDTDFFTESDENFSLITLPILGFKELKEALVYFFEHTDHYVAETQYYNQDYDELIDAHKSIKLEKLPPVLVLQLERYYNNGVVYNDGINIPSELDVTQICSQNLLDEEELDDEYSNCFSRKNEKNIYNLTGAIIRDSISHKFRALSKIEGKWFSYDSISPSSVKINNNQNCQVLTDEDVIQNSYVVFYTHRNARLPGVVNNVDTELELEHPFDLHQYIDEPTRRYLEELNFNFDQQRCAFSEPTMNFMVEHTTPIDYIRYFFNVLCHSIQHDEVSVGANHIIKDIIEKIPPNENNHYSHKTMLNSVSMPSTFIDVTSTVNNNNSGLSNNNNNHRHEVNGNQLLEYIQSDFENIVSSLTHSHFHQLISDIIVLILERTGDDQSFNFIKRCVDQIKDKKDYDQASPLSRLILKYILISDNNRLRALDTDWTQELIWYLYSVFDFNRSQDFLAKLDFSNLFNVLSILISKDHRPVDLYNLLKIKDQVAVSPRHRHSYIAFLIKLDTADILNSDIRNQSFSKAINDFERSLELLNEQATIPDDINLPDFFTELRRQIETGDENLRTNILNSFNSQLVPYLGNPDPEVRNSAKLLYYSAHENSTIQKNDLSIVQLLVNIGSAQECSTIIEVVNTLMKRNNLYEDKYITFLFQNSSSMKSSLCSSTSLILSVISQYDNSVIENNLELIIDNVSGDYEELIDFILQRFAPESIARTLDYHRWKDILSKIDKNHYVSLIQNLLPLLSQEENDLKTRSFITNSILKDESLTLMNSFLSSTIKLFESPNNFAKLLKLVNYTIRRANETMSNSEECQYYQRSLIKVSDIIVHNTDPEEIRRGEDFEAMSRSSSSLSQSSQSNNNNNNSNNNNSSSQANIPSSLINTDEVISFFNNFWGQLCSDRLLELILLVCKYDNNFEEEMIRDLETRMGIRVEHFEKDKWYLAIICSRIVLNHENDQTVEQISSRLKSIYDQSVKQHVRKEKSRPDEIFDFYLKQTNPSRQQQDARWIVDLAQRLLPEAHFLSDEERKFYERIFSNENDTPKGSPELDEVVRSLIEQPTENLAPVGGLDLQRSALLARQRENVDESLDVKKQITDNYRMSREEAMRLARQDWFLEKFVSYLYGEVESAPESLDIVDDDDEDLVSEQNIEEEPMYNLSAKERGIIDFNTDNEESLLERRREQERQEELRRQSAQIEAQKRQEERLRAEQEQREREAQREKEQQEQREREAQREREQQEQREREAQREREQQEQREREAQAQREKEQQEQREREAQAQREKEQQEQREREAQAQREREAQAQREKEQQEQREREAQAQREREAQREKEQQEQREREQHKGLEPIQLQDGQVVSDRGIEFPEQHKEEQPEVIEEEEEVEPEQQNEEQHKEQHEGPEPIQLQDGQVVSDRGIGIEFTEQHNEEQQKVIEEEEEVEPEQHEEQPKQHEGPEPIQLQDGQVVSDRGIEFPEQHKEEQPEVIEEEEEVEPEQQNEEQHKEQHEEQPKQHEGIEPIKLQDGQVVSDRGISLGLPSKGDELNEDAELDVEATPDQNKPALHLQEKPEPQAADSGVAAQSDSPEEHKQHSAQEVGSAAVVAASYLIMQFLKERQKKQ